MIEYKTRDGDIYVDVSQGLPCSFCGKVHIHSECGSHNIEHCIEHSDIKVSNKTFSINQDYKINKENK